MNRFTKTQVVVVDRSTIVVSVNFYYGATFFVTVALTIITNTVQSVSGMTYLRRVCNLHMISYPTVATLNIP